MTEDLRRADELRAMFGDNLRRLAQNYPSVSALCRELGINRTQFNRYLCGESLPRADVLDRICRFFEVDARIVLSPLDDIPSPATHPAAPVLTHFLASGTESASPGLFASGFYQVSNIHRVTLLHAKAMPQCTLIRGYAPRASMPNAHPKERELRGIAASTGELTYILMSHRNGRNSQIFVVAQQADRWQGTAFSAAEKMAPKPVVLNHLGDDRTAALDAARYRSANGDDRSTAPMP